MSTDTAVVDAEYWRMPALVTELTDTINAVESHVRWAVANAIRVGQLLTEAKENVPHGTWEAWLQQNCRLAPRTCRAYMSFATRCTALPPQERQRVADLPLREAMRAITTEPDAPTRPPKYEVQDRTDAERIVKGCDEAIGALKEIKRWSVPGITIKPAKVHSMRVRLQAALVMLDGMTGELVEGDPT